MLTFVGSRMRVRKAGRRRCWLGWLECAWNERLDKLNTIADEDTRVGECGHYGIHLLLTFMDSVSLQRRALAAVYRRAGKYQCKWCLSGLATKRQTQMKNPPARQASEVGML